MPTVLITIEKACRTVTKSEIFLQCFILRGGNKFFFFVVNTYAFTIETKKLSVSLSLDLKI